MDTLHKSRSVLALAVVLGLSIGTVGCNDKGGESGSSEAKAPAAQGKVVATVNGELITESELGAYLESRPRSAPRQPEEAMLDELVTQTVVYQEALRLNLDKDPKMAQELKLMRIRLLASAAVRKVMDEQPITDEALQAEYESLKEKMMTTEYKARHILVKEEALAKEIIGQLDQGKDFAELAKQHSTDSSGKNGGDLGWFNPRQMVPAFSKAVAELDKGSYTKAPVKSQFGWHVIKLEDSRQSEPPAFDEIKGRLEQMLKQRRVSDYIEELKAKAQITIAGKKEEEAPKDEQEKAASDTQKSGEAGKE